MIAETCPYIRCCESASRLSDSGQTQISSLPVARECLDLEAEHTTETWTEHRVVVGNVAFRHFEFSPSGDFAGFPSCKS